MGKTLFVPKKGDNVFEVEFEIKRPKKRYNIKPLKINGEACKNLGKVNKPDKPKIYVLIWGKRIIYIGGTGDNLRERLDPSLNHEQYPYEWRDIPERLMLVVFVVPDEYFNPVEKGRYAKGIGAIEAELVYMVRRSGKWPDYQTEIHFHSTMAITRDNARAIAQYLIDEGLAENITVDNYV